eukprot:5143995-Amphidinium_carterae.1
MSAWGLISQNQPAAPPQNKRAKTEGSLLDKMETLVMMAVCEVITHPSITKHKDNIIWVAPKEETVTTRFLLVFADMKQLSSRNVRMTANLEEQIRQKMQKLGVG